MLLCDAIGLESKVVNTSFLRTLLLLGSYLEWEGIAAHDLFHRNRDELVQTPNAYLYWKASKQGAREMQDDMSPKDVAVLFLKAATRRRALTQVFEGEEKPAADFDLTLCLSSSRAIIGYYQLHEFVAE